MTAAAIPKLQRAGFSEEQVQALAEHFNEQRTTKSDLSPMVEGIRGEQRAVEARIETEVEQARADTIKWVIGVGVAQAATILAVRRLFPGHP